MEEMRIALKVNHIYYAVHKDKKGIETFLYVKFRHSGPGPTSVYSDVGERFRDGITKTNLKTMLEPGQLPRHRGKDRHITAVPQRIRLPKTYYITYDDTHE
jgi:hypothetical protein